MSDRKPEDLITEIYGKVCSIEGTLANRCKDRERRIDRLEKKTSWTYLIGGLVVLSEIAYKFFK